LPNTEDFKTFVKFLLFIGCIEASQSGSHIKFKKTGLKRPVIVPKKKNVYPDVVSSNLKTLRYYL